MINRGDFRVIIDTVILRNTSVPFLVAPPVNIAPTNSTNSILPELRSPPATLVDDLTAFAGKSGYRGKAVDIFCVADATACAVAKQYYDTLRLVPGWTVRWGGTLPFAEEFYAGLGTNILTMKKDEKDLDRHADKGSPFGLWQTLNVHHVSCGGWYQWPSVFKDLKPNTFVLLVGFNVPHDKCR